MKTYKLKKVLIALDYNPTAQKVAETGYALAKSMKANVILLHVISDPLFYSNAEYSPIMGFQGYLEMGPQVIKSAEGLKKASLNFLNKSKQHLGDKNIELKVNKGEIADTILKTAKTTASDIIVMGSHSLRWLENIVLGSVTEEVLHRTSIPLYIIPTKKH